MFCEQNLLTVKMTDSMTDHKADAQNVRFKQTQDVDLMLGYVGPPSTTLAQR